MIPIVSPLKMRGIGGETIYFPDQKENIKAIGRQTARYFFGFGGVCKVPHRVNLLHPGIRGNPVVERIDSSEMTGARLFRQKEGVFVVTARGHVEGSFLIKKFQFILSIESVP